MARTTPAGTARSRLSRRTSHDGEALGTWRCPWMDALLWPPSSLLRLALAPVTWQAHPGAQGPHHARGIKNNGTMATHYHLSLYPASPV